MSGRALGLIGLFLISSGAALPAADVRSQDGMGFGALIPDASVDPLDPSVTMTGYPFPGGVTLGEDAFRGSVLDDAGNIWLVPADADKIVKVAPSGSMSLVDLPVGITGTRKFAGGAFDGTHIWLVPADAASVVRVTVADNTTQEFNGWPVTMTATDRKFAGAVFDGTHVWLVPHRSSVVVKVDVSDGSMTDVSWGGNYTPVDFDFWGGVYDGTNVWLIPFDAPSVVQIVAATDVVSTHASWPVGFTKGTSGFTGGTFDGTHVWLAPFQATHLVRVAVADGAMEGYTGFPSGTDVGNDAFEGAVYDGAGIWLIPHNASLVVRVNPADGSMTGDSSWSEAGMTKPGNAFAGASFDGDEIWLAPKAARRVVKLSTDVSAPDVSSINRLTPSGSATNATSVVYRVTFSELVSGVDVTDFELNLQGTATGTISSVSAASGQTIDVTVNTISGDGDIRLDLKASGTGIEDNASIPIAGGFTSGQVYTIDNIAPTISSADSADGTYRNAFSFTVTASGSPVSFGASGLPSGLSITALTGEIAGEPTQAGVFAVTVTATDAAGNVGSDSLELTIAPASLTVTGITADNRVYDGSTTADLVTTGATLVGVLGGDSVTLVTSGATGAFADKSVGTGKVVTVSGLTLGGPVVANYSLTQPTTTADITAANLTVTGVTVAGKIYDGTTAATANTSGATLNGVADGDTVSLDATAVTATFADKAVAASKPVAISGFSLAGADAGNYTLTQPSATSAITALGLSVTGITAADKVYDGTTAATPNAAGAALATVLAGDTVTLDANGVAAAFADKSVGTGKTVAISGLTLGGADAGNYALIQPTATASITAAGLTVAGVTAADKTYDGTVTAQVNTAGATLGGALVGGDTVSLDVSAVSATFADNTVGSGKVVTVSGLALAGPDAGNYTLTQPTGTASITAKALTVTGIIANNKQYDGTTTATLNVTSAVLVGVVGADVVVLDTTAVVGTFDSATSGASKPVAITGLTITGADVGNYSITQPSATANITASAATVTITNTTQIFDGAPKPVTVTTNPAGLTVTVSYDGSATVPSTIGSYGVVATITETNYSGSASATLVIGPNSRLLNMSARAQVGVGDDILIPGFVITGTGNKTFLIRGIGPTLAEFDVPGVLAAPTLTLVSEGVEIATNTGWSTSPDADAIAQTAAAVNAFPLEPDSADSVLLVSLEPGLYTAKLSGVENTTGVGLVEVYDADDAPSGARLVNISARAQVGIGADVLIPGFVSGGTGARRYLIRAIGPTLGDYDVQGVLADPMLTIHSGDDVVATNDDWSTAVNAADIVTVSQQVLAFPLASDSKDAAALVTLDPGAYTVVVSGVGETSGVALVEIYEVLD